jgi:hypothetical protein
MEKRVARHSGKTGVQTIHASEKPSETLDLIKSSKKIENLSQI